jgi:sugar lactone lactonase YvrE
MVRRRAPSAPPKATRKEVHHGCVPVHGPDDDGADPAHHRLGPHRRAAVACRGAVTCVDLAGSRLWRWDPADSVVTVVREQTGEGHGGTLDLQGRLIMGEGAAHRRMTRMDAAGTVTTLADRWHGTRFTTPNDVVCRSDGSIFGSLGFPGVQNCGNINELCPHVSV